MRILTYITTEEDAGRAARSVVPRRFQLGTHAFRRLKVEGGILCDGAPLRAVAFWADSFQRKKKDRKNFARFFSVGKCTLSYFP